MRNFFINRSTQTDDADQLPAVPNFVDTEKGKLKAETAETPEEAEARLRQILDKADGLKSRIDERKVKINLLAQRDLADLSEVELGEYAKLEAEVKLLEMSLRRIEGDEWNLRPLAANGIEIYRTQTEKIMEARMTKVRNAAREALSALYPEGKLNYEAEKLPGVRREAVRAYSLINCGGNAVLWCFGEGGRIEVQPRTPTMQILNGLEAARNALEEAKTIAGSRINLKE